MNQKRKQVITSDKMRALRCKSLKKNKEIETAINVALKRRTSLKLLSNGV